jgi:hypothetical protein
MWEAENSYDFYQMCFWAQCRYNPMNVIFTKQKQMKVITRPRTMGHKFIFPHSFNLAGGNFQYKAFCGRPNDRLPLLGSPDLLASSCAGARDNRQLI